MAPEVMRQEGHGRFADIWSLGCLVVEMATGKPPWYYKTNQIAVFMHVCTTDEAPHLPPELSEAAKDFILSCFKRKPSERPNVCKLLKHPFISSLRSPQLEMGIVRNEENYASNSTKFSTMEPRFRADVSVESSIIEMNERNSIITTAKFKIETCKQETIELYLRRPSFSSNSDSEESKQKE